MAVTKRCIRCNKKVRVPEGTCQNPKCVLYVPPKPKEEPKPQETPSDDTTTPSTGDNE